MEDLLHKTFPPYVPKKGEEYMNPKVSVKTGQAHISQKWTLLIRDWKAALTRFATQFRDLMRRR